MLLSRLAEIAESAEKDSDDVMSRRNRGKMGYDNKRDFLSD